MKKKKQSIEDYVRGYIEKLSSEDGRKKYLPEAESKFSDAVSSALKKRAKSAASYGARAEGLAASGLSSSGYAESIERNADKKLTEAIGRAGGDTLKSLASAEEAELQAENEFIELEQKLADYAIKHSLRDYDTLYDYARSIGLDAKRAKSAAEKAINASERHERDTNFTTVHRTIVYRRLTQKEAYEYAISLGLSEEDARKLGNIAYKMNEDTSAP